MAPVDAVFGDGLSPDFILLLAVPEPGDLLIGHSDDLKTPGLVLRIRLFHTRMAFPAGHTPAPPEIDEDDLALECRDIDHLPVEAHLRERDHRLADGGIPIAFDLLVEVLCRLRLLVLVVELRIPAGEFIHRHHQEEILQENQTDERGRIRIDKPYPMLLVLFSEGTDAPHDVGIACSVFCIQLPVVFLLQRPGVADVGDVPVPEFLVKHHLRTLGGDLRSKCLRSVSDDGDPGIVQQKGERRKCHNGLAYAKIKGRIKDFHADKLRLIGDTLPLHQTLL